MFKILDKNNFSDYFPLLNNNSRADGDYTNLHLIDFNLLENPILAHVNQYDVFSFKTQNPKIIHYALMHDEYIQKSSNYTFFLLDRAFNGDVVNSKVIKSNNFKKHYNFTNHIIFSNNEDCVYFNLKMVDKEMITLHSKLESLRHEYAELVLFNDFERQPKEKVLYPDYFNIIDIKTTDERSKYQEMLKIKRYFDDYKQKRYTLTSQEESTGKFNADSFNKIAKALSNKK